VSIVHRRIAGTDLEWHDRFFHFVGGVFPGIDPQRWASWRNRGAWRDPYEVLALVDGEQIVSTIGLTRMRLVVDGVAQNGFQLGAVATLPGQRGQGLSRHLMDWVFEELASPNGPIFLFANESVLDFYPRFGFRQIPQRRWLLSAEIAPDANRVTCFDPDSAEDRDRLAALCARAAPIAGPLSTRDYYPIALWHLTCTPISGFWLDDRDTFVAADMEGGRLAVHDIIATEPRDLRPALASLAAAPVDTVAFGFDPSPWFAGARPIADAEADAQFPLFVRGAPSILGPLAFPGLAKT